MLAQLYFCLFLGAAPGLLFVYGQCNIMDVKEWPVINVPK